jgi:4-hydroxybenzoate polyprenyltransferase/phosphoserine phosphatase
MSQPVIPVAGAESHSQIPLCVDLDDTLICTDALWESVIQLWRRPILGIRAAYALLSRGKAGMKDLLAENMDLDPSTLPYRESVLTYLRQQQSEDRELVLATATHSRWAQRIADHLGLFSRVFATDDRSNLSSTRKRDALVSAYGEKGFDYIGDHRKDLPIFAAARESLLVNPSPSLLARASAAGNVTRVFAEDGLSAKVVAKALRLHQWSKNILLAVPLLSAHLVLNPGAWFSIAVAFVGFGLVASATYLFNDLLDLGADRLHAKKRFRPLASGRMKISTGVALAVLTASCGFGITCLLLPPQFLFYLLVYVALTLAYSINLKRRLLVDVLALALLYTLRILAGGAAIGVPVSEWLLMFSLFIFLSLAFLKRAIELQSSGSNEKITGRGYSSVDLDTVRSIGTSSGLVSVMVLSLYINSEAVTALYRAPKMLWLLCPLLIYWISRIWFLAARGEVHHDPVVFALLDWRSYVVGACGVIILSLATVGMPTLHL